MVPNLAHVFIGLGLGETFARSLLAEMVVLSDFLTSCATPHFFAVTTIGGSTKVTILNNNNTLHCTAVPKCLFVKIFSKI